MREITQQQIDSWAPNAKASANGRKISQQGLFVTLECSEDDTFYIGECKGSGKKNYITSVDFVDPGDPVFRCSCPSRQFPCKHSLALLYEIKDRKTFTQAPIPEDILTKRARKQARAQKQEAQPQKPEQPQQTDGAAPEPAPAAPAPAKKAKGNTAAKAKKLSRQLEGLDLTAKLVRDLLNGGLGSMGGTSLPAYRSLAKQLGDYYLPGPQRLLNRLILEVEAYQKDGSDSHFETAIDTLERLWTLVKQARQYLQQKLDQGDVGPDNSVLFEELGGAWRLEDLMALGLSRQNVRLAQLAFWVTKDDARAELIDVGCWADLDTGAVNMTYNYRPYKALKYVKQEDSVFGKCIVPELACYPGEGNPRIRWNSAQLEPLTEEDLASLRSHAEGSLNAAVKTAKNVLKNTMAPPMEVHLLKYAQIGTIDGQPVVQDAEGTAVALGDVPGMQETISELIALPDAALMKDQVLLGGIWYDRENHQMKIQPLSIVTATDVVRLLY